MKASDQALLKGYLLKWKKPNVLVSCALYIDAPKPVSLLSLTLQRDNVDVVHSIEGTHKSAKVLQSMAKKNPSEWPTADLLKKLLKVVDGQLEYQEFLYRI